MRYVLTDQAYREFRGHVFIKGKPVTIIDRGTLEAIKKEPAFEEYHEQQAQDPDSCPKCGKVVKQGKYMHVKFCKG